MFRGSLNRKRKRRNLLLAGPQSQGGGSSRRRHETRTGVPEFADQLHAGDAQRRRDPRILESSAKAKMGAAWTWSLRTKGSGCHGEHTRLFDPYFTTRPDGTGLGSAIAERIVYDHGGTILVESTLGAGTIMTVRLPTRKTRRLKTGDNKPVNGRILSSTMSQIFGLPWRNSVAKLGHS